MVALILTRVSTALILSMRVFLVLPVIHDWKTLHQIPFSFTGLFSEILKVLQSFLERSLFTEFKCSQRTYIIFWSYLLLYAFLKVKVSCPKYCFNLKLYASIFFYHQVENTLHQSPFSLNGLVSDCY